MSELMPNIVTETVDFQGKTLTLETGRWAKQAAGSVVVRHEDTVVLVCATTTGKAREGMSFFPLSCDYVEKTYAAGKLPGGFFKREGRPTDNAKLTSRLIDRPLRPLFPDGFMHEVQIVATVLSIDGVGDPHICALIGASAALHISEIPWAGPVAACMVGRGPDGKLVANPSYGENEDHDLDLLVAGRKDGIVMVEGGGLEVPEDEVIEALKFGFDAMQPVLKAIESLRKKAGKKKTVYVPEEPDKAFQTKIRKIALPLVKKAAFIPEKLPRYAAMAEVKKKVIAKLGDEGAARKGEVKDYVGDLKSEVVREKVLADGKRIDGRSTTDIRQIQCDLEVLPRTHGSSVFTRGETQALVTVTFGTRRDEQRIDDLQGQRSERFMLHYNFPPFSVGEVKFLRGPGRREIGHGYLAHRGLLPLLPERDDFPYTIRCVSEILESNGSSSMATVCGSSLAMMQAGVPLSAPAAGIAMGLISDGKRTAILSDILGDEDHLGDMDFKVVGTEAGITAVQMDIKVESLPWDILTEALHQACDGRKHILAEMAKVISEPADDLAEHAPRIFTVLIDPDKIRDLIGPGGKHIKGIVADTGVDIDVQDDGRVDVAAVDGESAVKAIELIKGYTEEPEVGKIYLGKVARTVDFGAFVTIKPGTDGLCHISELAEGRVRQTEDVVKEGDEVLVKVIGIDRQGKIKLSRAQALAEQGDSADA